MLRETFFKSEDKKTRKNTAKAKPAGVGLTFNFKNKYFITELGRRDRNIKTSQFKILDRF